MESQLHLLQQKHLETLQRCQLRIDGFAKFKHDYQTLKQRLLTIADKTKHEAMIPVVPPLCGQQPIALVPGYVHHTNEILVLLGDNWFVERSAKEAAEIVDRRLAKCEQMLAKLNEEKQQYENWLNFANKIAEEKGNLVEIVEEFDEESEKKWREEHRIKVKRQKEIEAKERTKNADYLSVDELFKKLGLESDDSFDDEKDEVERKFNGVEKESECDQQNVSQMPTKSILKKNGDKTQQRKSVAFDIKTREESIPIVTDPVVYPIPKPVYKESDSQSKNIKKPTLPKQKAEKAFTGEIVEREVSEASSANSTEAVSAPIRTSKFKASRRTK